MASFSWNGVARFAGFDGAVVMADMRKGQVAKKAIADIAVDAQVTKLNLEAETQKIRNSARMSEKANREYPMVFTVWQPDLDRFTKPQKGVLAFPERTHSLDSRASMDSIDGSPPEELSFQFSPESIEINGQSTWAKTGTFSRGAPLHQFNAEECDTLSFSTVLAAPTPKFRTGAELMRYVRRLRFLKQRQSLLGRPPVFLVSCGDMEFGTMIVTSLGIALKQIYDGFRQISYVSEKSSTFSPDTESIALNRNQENVGGFSHYAEIKVTAEAWTPDAVGSISTREDKKKLSNSYEVLVQEGEQWEHIARRTYGSPSYGESLRRMFPLDVKPRSGEVYSLPRREKLLHPILGPSAIPLQRTEEGLALFSAISESRLRAHYVSVI